MDGIGFAVTVRWFGHILAKPLTTESTYSVVTGSILTGIFTRAVIMKGAVVGVLDEPYLTFAFWTSVIRPFHRF